MHTIEQQPGIESLQRNIDTIWLGRLKVADSRDSGTAVKAKKLRPRYLGLEYSLIQISWFVDASWMDEGRHTCLILSCNAYIHVCLIKTKIKLIMYKSTFLVIQNILVTSPQYPQLMLPRCTSHRKSAKPSISNFPSLATFDEFITHHTPALSSYIYCLDPATTNASRGPITSLWWHQWSRYGRGRQLHGPQHAG